MLTSGFSCDVDSFRVIDDSGEVTDAIFCDDNNLVATVWIQIWHVDTENNIVRYINKYYLPTLWIILQHECVYLGLVVSTLDLSAFPLLLFVSCQPNILTDVKVATLKKQAC